MSEKELCVCHAIKVSVSTLRITPITHIHGGVDGGVDGGVEAMYFIYRSLSGLRIQQPPTLCQSDVSATARRTRTPLSLDLVIC